MATGMFRTDDGSVQVDYDGNNIPYEKVLADRGAGLNEA